MSASPMLPLKFHDNQDISSLSPIHIQSMDGDPRVESELDSFSRTLPLPYRIAILLVLGMCVCVRIGDGH